MGSDRFGEQHEADGQGATDAAPALGVPLAVEFGNTIYPSRRILQDALDSGPRAISWFLPRADAFQPALRLEGVSGMDDLDLRRLVRLRDAVRAALQAAVEGREIPADVTAELNAASALSPQWPTLTGEPPSITLLSASPDPFVEAAAAIARSAVYLLGGPLRAQLRACQTPDCPLFFIKDHPRRAWCTPACGNRARVSRYHARHHASRGVEQH